LVVNAAETGSSSISQTSNNLSLLSDNQGTFVPMDHAGAMEFNANPPPIITEIRGDNRSAATVPFIAPAVGDTRNFWVETYYASSSWIQKTATLRATGKYGNIWVMNENFSKIDGGKNDRKITASQAVALANKFDLIYPIETNLLGYEYGGGPGGNGGQDGDPKVQILVYDIVDSSGEVKAAGFFWAKDYYPQSQLGTSLKTNLAEIFYLNVSSIDNSPDYMYSTLVHEFQHMINFNVKYIQYGENSASWYNEMLSEMAEDVISPLIGIDSSNSGHPIQSRIYTFLETYNQVGLTEWITLDSVSYAKGFAFGAYLMRNWGGAELIQKILANNITNVESISAALNEIEKGLNFEKALTRYGEALIFSGKQMPKGTLSFDKTVSKTINGINYTVTGFDMWNMYRYNPNAKGPLIFDLSPIEMRPYSILLQSTDIWKNRTGNISLILNKPNNNNIDLYVLVR
jgi:hypothetical protein